jgi:hypothetical protein
LSGDWHRQRRAPSPETTSIPLPKQLGHSEDGDASVNAVVASIACEAADALLLRFSEELIDGKMERRPDYNIR